MEPQNAVDVVARFEELSLLEEEFEEAECEIIRKTNTLNAPLYKKRSEVVAQIPHFWAIVFEQAPPDVDNFIQPSDSNLFAECLESLEVSRFEIDEPNGSPRSFSITFGFKENEYFEDKTLEKKFWYRIGSHEWEGLVSEPVKIHWKKGKDLTDGLTDAAYDLFQANSKSGGAKKSASLPEHKALAKKLEESELSSNSFFTWFGFVSSYKWVSAEENLQGLKEKNERIAKQKSGDFSEEQDEDQDMEEEDYQETEVFPQGDELATLIADDMWPSAIKYFKHAHEVDDEDLSELEIMDDDDDSDGEIDIRALVGKGKNGSSESPPPKKQRKV